MTLPVSVWPSAIPTKVSGTAHDLGPVRKGCEVSAKGLCKAGDTALYWLLRRRVLAVALLLTHLATMDKILHLKLK